MKEEAEGEKFEIYETYEGHIIVFLGMMGFNGLLIFRPEKQWKFQPAESKTWDLFHQAVYRNGKADRLTKEALNERGIPPPPVEQYKEVPLMRWEDNFPKEVPFSHIPEQLRGRLMEGPKMLFLVLCEDLYETCLGDGKFLYPDAVFWTEAEAKAYVDSNPPAFAYSLKEVRVTPDPSRKVLIADLNIEHFEHYSIEDIIHLLDKSTREGQGVE